MTIIVNATFSYSYHLHFTNCVCWLLSRPKISLGFNLDLQIPYTVVHVSKMLVEKICLHLEVCFFKVNHFNLFRSEIQDRWLQLVDWKRFFFHVCLLVSELYKKVVTLNKKDSKLSLVSFYDKLICFSSPNDRRDNADRLLRSAVRTWWEVLPKIFTAQSITPTISSKSTSKTKQQPRTTPLQQPTSQPHQSLLTPATTPVPHLVSHLALDRLRYLLKHLYHIVPTLLWRRQLAATE